MGRLFTMPYSIEPGVWEGEIYKGNAATAAQFGVLRFNEVGSSVQRHYHQETGAFIEEGWRFGRKMLEQDPTTGAVTVWDKWVPLHGQGKPPKELEKLLVKVDFEVQAQPGNNAKDPDGFLLWVNGATVTQPGSGEPAINPWTGLPSGGTVP